MCRLLVDGWLGQNRFHVGLFLYLSNEQSRTTDLSTEYLCPHNVRYVISFFKNVSPELNRQANNNKIRVPLNMS